ncbi:hypothetical protein [Nocardia sp. CA-290969]|uniref:hypothetical protein n=1 Tax=Nocardia sp. CA-290969 TaxID=3239986 RepID=UPI003D8BFEEB
MIEETRDRLPDPDAELVRDPAYLHARIQGILAEANAYAAERPDEDADRLKAFSLRYDLERSAADIRLFSDAGDSSYETLSIEAPSVPWRRGQGFYTFAPTDESAEEAADALGIPERPAGVNGRRAWAGEFDGFAVRIYSPDPVQEPNQ